MRQQGCNEYKKGILHYLGFPPPCWVPPKASPHNTCDAFEPNKVLGSLSNAIFPSIFTASLLPPCKEEINSY